MPDVMLNAAAGGQKPQTPAVVFCQDGARLHYAIPIALRRAGMLAGLYTEWYRDGSRRANLALAVLRLLSPENARRFNLRHAPELDGAPIFSLRLTGPLFIIAARRANKFFRAVHQTWWQAAAARGPLGRPQGKDAVCFGFLFSMLPAAYTNRIRARGFRIVIDMPIAAMAEAVRQQRAAIDRWPGWELIDDAPAQAKGDPDVQEIDKITDHWTCASE